MKKWIIVLFCCFSHSLYAQQSSFDLESKYAKYLVNVFSYINEGKLLKAEEEWQDIEEKFAKDKIDKNRYNSAEEYLHPIWRLSVCYMHNTKGDRHAFKRPVKTAYDPWQAYSILRSCTQKSTDIAIANQFLAHKKIKLSIDSIKRSIENNLVDTVSRIGTEEAYDKLIATLYNYSNINNIKEQQESVAYNQVIKTIQVSECKRFLNKYKNASALHRNAVIERRDSLAFDQLAQTSVSCEQYIQEYPESRYLDEVKSLMYQYAFNELEKTEESCMKYIRRYPQSPFCEKVKQMQVEYAFNEAKSENAISAYKSFLRKYSDSVYSQEARSLLGNALFRKYHSNNTSIKELEYYIRNEQNAAIEGNKKICALYYNLINLPKSSLMMELDNIVGRVNITTENNKTMSSYEEKFEINDQGLITRHSNLKSGVEYTYLYHYEDQKGWQLSNRTDEKGKVIHYSTTYNDLGLLSTISGDDGTKEVYSYDGGILKDITYSKGGSVIKTDTYNDSHQLTSSKRNGVTIVYEYNERSDVISMKKMKGNSIMGSTNYEYDYDTRDGMWHTQRQYNDGDLVLTKHRDLTSASVISAISNDGHESEQRFESDMPEEVIAEADDIEDSIFGEVEKGAQFPGGDDACFKWLADHIIYPEIAKENGIQGRVFVQFVVNTDGTISEIEILRSPDPSLSKEVIRLFNLMPKWTPASQGGKNVRSRFNTSVIFKL